MNRNSTACKLYTVCKASKFQKNISMDKQQNIERLLIYFFLLIKKILMRKISKINFCLWTMLYFFFKFIHEKYYSSTVGNITIVVHKILYVF